MCASDAQRQRHGVPTPAYLTIATIVSENPCLTLREIGEKVGVTREYVRQVVAREALERVKYARVRGKPVRVARLCEVCGKLMDRDIKGNRHRACFRWVPFICKCGKSFQLRESGVLATIRAGQQVGIYCSNRCKWDSLKKQPDLEVSCLVCGITFTADVHQRHAYLKGRRRFLCKNPACLYSFRHVVGPATARLAKV